jgi:hexosaminidase
MLFPRICALAENTWSQADQKDFSNFTSRLFVHFNMLDKMKINYAKSIFEVNGKVSPSDAGPLSLFLRTFDKSATIRYWTSADTIVKNYTSPIIINKPVSIYAATFRNGAQLSETAEWNFIYTIATGKSLTLRKQPDKSYNNGGAFSLVDGQTGSIPWKGSDWLGWWGDTLDIIIDLGKDTLIQSISFEFLKDTSSWIYPPSSFDLEVSSDGVKYAPFSGISLAPSNSMKSPCVGILHQSYVKEMARYIHLVVYPGKTIPAGSPGAGNPSWLFISEIEVE